MEKDILLKPPFSAHHLGIDYPKELNPQQLAAVTAGDGPALVIAGAGSGKTRTLTFRLAWLVEQGLSPDNVLLLTFTNKAAQEMMRRAQDLIGGHFNPQWSGTFHHLAHRGLRRHASIVGYERDFTILDRDDAKDLIKASLEGQKIDVKIEPFPKAEVLAEIFSLASNCEKTVGAILAEDYPYFEHLEDRITHLRHQYGQRKRKAGAMDYDDLLLLWRQILQEHPEIRQAYSLQFRYLLVDEYQDTNKIQADIVDLMAEAHKNVMVVGDDAQSIFSWRGANFKNIIHFPDRYPHCKVFKIETNYRSVPEILATANEVISYNHKQFPKALSAARPSGAKPVLVPCADANQQALFVAQQIRELRDQGTPLEEIAVLYRNHFHAMELQMELTRNQIPFLITSGLRFFEQAHIKDVAAFLKLMVNTNDELAFKRMTQLLPGIGGKTAEKLWEEFRTPESAVRIGAMKRLKTVPKKATAEWTKLSETFAVLGHLFIPTGSNPVEASAAAHPETRSTTSHSVSEIIQTVVDRFYAEYLQVKFPDFRNRHEDLDQLVFYATQFQSVSEFLAQLTLMTNLEADSARTPAHPGTEMIRLSTVHQAKGLEWGAVFVIGLADGMFPSHRSLGSDEELGEKYLEKEEEERRLFYVAITRAKDELYLCYPLMQAFRGNSGGDLQKPSRFVAEIPKSLYVQANLRTAFDSREHEF